MKTKITHNTVQGACCIAQKLTPNEATLLLIAVYSAFPRSGQAFSPLIINNTGVPEFWNGPVFWNTPMPFPSWLIVGGVTGYGNQKTKTIPYPAAALPLQLSMDEGQCYGYGFTQTYGGFRGPVMPDNKWIRPAFYGDGEVLYGLALGANPPSGDWIQGMPPLDVIINGSANVDYAGFLASYPNASCCSESVIPNGSVSSPIVRNPPMTEYMVPQPPIYVGIGAQGHWVQLPPGLVSWGEVFNWGTDGFHSGLLPRVGPVPSLLPRNAQNPEIAVYGIPLTDEELVTYGTPIFDQGNQPLPTSEVINGQTVGVSWYWGNIVRTRGIAPGAVPTELDCVDLGLT